MEKQFHPLTEVFPLADSDAFTKLAEDIRLYGLHEPIVLYEDMVLDGRSRYRACVLVGVEPRYTTIASTATGEHREPTREEALQWLVQRNLSERNLSKAQLAVLSVDLLNITKKASFSAAEMKEAAAQTGAAWSSVERLVAIQKRNKAIVEEVRRGTLTIAQASRDAGFIEYDEAPIPGRNEYYGKGDKFREATEPLVRYLRGWELRGYEFKHVAPKEAQQRLARIDRLIEGLQEARKDIEQRSHKATLSHPS